MDLSGILHHTFNRDDGTFSLAQVPLEEVKINAWVVDVTARVTVIQRFYNASPTRTGRAKYCFPIPASAVICAFQLKSSDGRIVKGECKEKDLAEEEYEAAVASGQLAGLLDYVTDDVFTISIGHIPPYAVLEAHLVYVMTLYTGDYMDQVRFQLPYHVGQRYGIPPETLATLPAPSFERTRVSITMDIQTSGRIESISSPSHPSITETRYATHLGRASRRRTTVRYNSPQYLDCDFVVVIRARDLDKPRCFVEVRSDPQHRYPDSLALQLTMVPRTKMPVVKSQRYLFVVDRSGSMDGARIDTAKKILIMMLRMLPAHGSTFNIFGFGNTCTSWRQSSEPYTQYTLEEATSYAEAILADHGGTEIRSSLRTVFQTSPPDMPTAVFLLTDGEAYDVEETTAEVAEWVRSSNAPRRVFTLGIGNSVSTAMCEGIARAGNGEFLLAVHTESILQKCAKLFNAARSPFLRGISINWGNISTTPGVTFSHQGSPRSVATRSLPLVQQAPHTIHAIHVGTRMNIFALITSRHAKPPKEIVVSGVLDDEFRQPFQLRIAVQQIALVQSPDDIPLIHSIAASKLIEEYATNPTVPLPLPVGNATRDEVRQSAIVQLATQYQIASEYTSFVAIEEPSDGRMGRRLKQGFLRAHPELIEVEAESEESVHGLIETARMPMRAAWKAMTSALSALSAFKSLWDSRSSVEAPLLPSNSQESLPPGSWPNHDDDEEGQSEGGDRDGDGERDMDRATREPSMIDDDPTEVGSEYSRGTFSTLSSLDGWPGSESSDWSSSVSRDSDIFDDLPPSPTFHTRPLDREKGNQLVSGDTQDVSPGVVDLVKLQRFDGSFRRLERMRGLVGDAVVNERERLSGSEREVWTTVVGIAYLKKELSSNPELLENLLVKPLEYLRTKSGIDIDALLERAQSLL